MPRPRNRSLHGRANQAGILFAAANAPVTFERTLMPRGTMDQALVTGLSAAANHALISLVQESIQAAALVLSGQGGQVRARRPRVESGDDRSRCRRHRSRNRGTAGVLATTARAAHARRRAYRRFLALRRGNRRWPRGLAAREHRHRGTSRPFVRGERRGRRRARGCERRPRTPPRPARRRPSAGGIEGVVGQVDRHRYGRRRRPLGVWCGRARARRRAVARACAGASRGCGDLATGRARGRARGFRCRGAQHRRDRACTGSRTCRSPGRPRSTWRRRTRS